MVTSKVTQMKSIPIIANHMPTHVYQYLKVLDALVAQVLSDILSVLRESVRSKVAAASTVNDLLGRFRNKASHLLWSN